MWNMTDVFKINLELPQNYYEDGFLEEIVREETRATVKAWVRGEVLDHLRKTDDINLAMQKMLDSGIIEHEIEESYKRIR